MRCSANTLIYFIKFWRNVGESLQGSNRIYCVVRPEREMISKSERKRSVVGVSETNEEVKFIFFITQKAQGC